ncbi:hypothetical protein pdam_00016669 [Pocillopora damicornis]|uniref:Uncharacterized protein n=1 Tax=Pocillopora damicornis TaxID=46731 RepID=A0A3M6U8Y6_POCDA|nr:hypothetical protein pdam_00016669 [Pocillopora damicornis]
MDEDLPFCRKQRIISWTCGKATASNVSSQISSLRDDTGQTDWLIEQQVAQYFSRLSASPSVSMNEDEEVDADDLASQVETDRTRQKIRRGFAKFR